MATLLVRPFLMDALLSLINPLISGVLTFFLRAYVEINLVFTSITLTFESPPMYEIDGDLYQAASNVVRIGMAPNALRVLVG